MTRSRAVLISAFAVYGGDPTSALTSLVAQKLTHLIQTAGEPLKFEFTKAKFGPYAQTLSHAIQNMEGHFVLGYGNRTTGSDLHLVEGAETEARGFLSSDTETLGRVKGVGQLIECFESPFGLELLRTVHWAPTRDSARTADEALAVTAEWTPRKRQVFTDRDVAIAWKRLHNQDWLATEPVTGFQ